MSNKAIIDAIAEKTARLMAENKKLRQDQKLAAQTNDKLKTENRSLKEQTSRLEKRIAKLELQEGLKAGGDKKTARARVNRLMREVDKCIALMNK